MGSNVILSSSVEKNASCYYFFYDFFFLSLHPSYFIVCWLTGLCFNFSLGSSSFFFPNRSSDYRRKAKVHIVVENMLSCLLRVCLFFSSCSLDILCCSFCFYTETDPI